MGILTAAGATGQLIFLPVLANLTEQISWRAASLWSRRPRWRWCRLMLVLPTYPADRGVRAYGAPADDDPARPDPAGAAAGPSAPCRTRQLLGLAGASPSAGRPPTG